MKSLAPSSKASTARKRISGLLLAMALQGVSASPPAWSNDSSAVVHTAGTKIAHIRAAAHALKKRLRFANPDPFIGKTSSDAQLKVWDELIAELPSLRQLLHEARLAFLDHRPLSTELESRIGNEIRDILKQPEAPKKKIHAALIALNRLESVYQIEIAGAAPPLPQNKGDGEKEPGSAEPSDGKSPESDQPPSEESGPDKDFPVPSETFESKNFEIPAESEDDTAGPPQIPKSIAHVNKENIGYFRQFVYQLIDARNGKWRATSVSESFVPKPKGGPERELVVLPGKSVGKPIPLLLPQGFIPETFENEEGKVWRSDSDNYYFEARSKSLKIPLYPMTAALRPLSPPELEIFTSSTGVRLEQWPSRLQEDVRALQMERERQHKAGSGRYAGPLGDYHLGVDLSARIAEQFLYRASNVPMDRGKTPVELAHGGAIQCSTATTILVSLLRDQFSIPCRAVVGFRGQSDSRRPGTSHVTADSTGHGWVEIPDGGGNWRGVDPTPYKKDVPTSQKKPAADNPFRPIHPEDQDLPEDEEKSLDGTPRPARKEKGFLGSLKELYDELLHDHAKQPEVQNEQANITRESLAEARPGQGMDLPYDPFDQIAQKDHPAVVAALRIYVRWAADFSLNTQDKLERINFLKSKLFVNQDLLELIQPVLTEATVLFAQNRPPLKQWLGTVLSGRKAQPLNQTVAELSQIKRHLEFTASLYPAGDKPFFKDLLIRIQKLFDQLSDPSIRNKSASGIRIAEDLLDNLPGKISADVLRERFQLPGALGDDTKTLEFAESIGRGELNDFRLSSLLAPYSQFMTQPVYRPAGGKVTTWYRSPLQSGGFKSILPTRDPRDKKRFIRLHPELSDEEALRSGKMYMLVKRHEQEIPRGRNSHEPERATVICWDGSGSMRGSDFDRFQSIFIGAMVDRALSDRGMGRRPRHRIYLIGFDKEVFSDIEITTVEQARDFIARVRERTSGTRSTEGTVIIPAIEAAALRIKNAQVAGDRALSEANIVVISDGEDTATTPERVKFALDSARNGNDQLSIMLSTVAVGKHSALLEQMASRNQSWGADRSLYSFWLKEDIAKLIKDSGEPPRPLNDFWTVQTYGQLPEAIRNSFDDLADFSDGFKLPPIHAHPRASGPPDRTLAEGEEFMRTYRPRPDRADGQDSDAVYLSRLRRVLGALGPELTQRDRALYLGEILAEWNRHFRRRWENYTPEEFAHLKYILNWVKDGQAGDLLK